MSDFPACGMESPVFAAHQSIPKASVPFASVHKMRICVNRTIVLDLTFLRQSDHDTTEKNNISFQSAQQSTWIARTNGISHFPNNEQMQDMVTFESPTEEKQEEKKNPKNDKKQKGNKKIKKKKKKKRLGVASMTKYRQQFIETN